MTMIGSQTRAMGKGVPTDVLVAATKDPDAFEAKIRRYEEVRDEAQQAQSEQRRLIEEVRSEAARLEEERAAGTRAVAETEARVRALESELMEREAALAAAERDLVEAQRKHALAEESLKHETEGFDRWAREQSDRQGREAASLAQREQALKAQEAQSTARIAAVEQREDRLRDVEQALRVYFEG